MATKFGTAFAGTPYASLLVHFGETVTYTPEGGVASTPTAIVEYDTEDSMFDEDGESEISRATVRIQTSDVANPGVRDSVTISGAVWTVESIQDVNDGVATVICFRSLSAERSHANYRKLRG